MEPLTSRFRSHLSDLGIDGVLLIGDSYCDADMYYLSHFLAGDKFAVLASQELIVLVSSMERGRALAESKADHVETTFDYGIKEKLAKHRKHRENAYIDVLKEFLIAHKIRRLGVQSGFPIGIFKGLTDGNNDLELVIIDPPFQRLREVKSSFEIDAITDVQRHTESAMEVAIGLIRASVPRGENLYLNDQPLTSEYIRTAIDIDLLKHGCEAMDTIVSGGPASANPHDRGSGPLPANSPIVIDIFPRSKVSRYFADLSRTVLRGEASDELLEVYDAVMQAQNTGINAVTAGVFGRDVHRMVCQTFTDLGYPIGEEKGFIHSTGHGVGLDIHEGPSLSEIGGTLFTGNVVTVEPGLYFPGIGGIRLEDLVVVTSGKCHNLTKCDRCFVV